MLHPHHIFTFISLLFINYGVLKHFTPFEADFLATANVSLPKSCPMYVASSGPEIIYFHLDVLLTVGIFISFYGVEILPFCGWVTLRSLLDRRLLEPYKEPYEDWKYRFV